MNGESFSVIDERLREIFTEKEGKESGLKKDFRKLVARFECGVEEGNEQTCSRYQSGRKGCAFREENGTFISCGMLNA